MARQLKDLRKLVDRFGNLCHYCGERCNARSGSGKQATRDHVVPRSLGGPNTQSNYVLSCAPCNNDRGTNLFYCRCDYCDPLLSAFMRTERYTDWAFAQLMKFNKPRILFRSKVWKVYVHDKQHHFKTWTEAHRFALNINVKEWA